jgi:putative transposase
MVILPPIAKGRRWSLSGSAESLNGHFRAGQPDQHWFTSGAEAKQIIEQWRIEYNTERPHLSLEQATPAAFAAAWETPEEPPD